MYTEDVEFYHDQGGLNTSKTEILQMIKENICGKVQRNLVEVYPIKDYGAVKIGYHTFLIPKNRMHPPNLVNLLPF